MRAAIDYLTNARLSGRLAGTLGARWAALYLAEQLRQAGYAPFGSEEYLSRVDVPAARLVGPVRLVVERTEYRHRLDFGELTAFSAGGRATGRLLVLRDEEGVSAQALKGSVVLIPERPAGFDLSATIQAAAEAQVAALLVEYGEPHWFHKTIYGGQGHLPVLRVRKSVAENLARTPGAWVQVELPLVHSTLPCQNVVGLLPGATSQRTLLLTAHYDHVGDDPKGDRFPGAADNASGVAVVLHVARELAQRRVGLPFNVVVAFLTGEESGLWGAQQLAASLLVPISVAINVDGVGIEPTLAAMRLGRVQAGDWLAGIAADVLTARRTRVDWITGSDDSSVFIRRGFSRSAWASNRLGPIPSRCTPLTTARRSCTGTHSRQRQWLS